MHVTLCPGCAQRKFQMSAAPCEMCGRINPVTPPVRAREIHPVARLLRWLLQPPGRYTHALTLLAAAFAVWAMTLHWITPFLGRIQIGLLFCGLIGSAGWALRLFTRAAVWIFAPATRQNPRPGAKNFLVLPLCLGVLWVLNRFDIPLHLAFRSSETALMKLARGAGGAGLGTGVKAPITPIPAGWYRVREWAVDPQKNPRFEVADNSFLWSGTKAGFAKCDNGCQSAKFPPAYMRSEPPKYIQLSRDWFWWQESGSDD